LFGAWTSLHEDVTFVQLFIGFFEPLCVYPLCYDFQKSLLFVSIALCILDMNKLEMFEFLEDELHVVGIVGPSLKTLETIVLKEMLQAQNVVDEECGFKKRCFECNS
jgi:hypothetical protein